MAQLFEEIKKYNPYHGADGKFTGASGAKTTTPGTKTTESPTIGGKNGELQNLLERGWDAKDDIGTFLEKAGRFSEFSYKEDLGRGEEGYVEYSWTKWSDNDLWSGTESFSEGGTYPCRAQSSKDLGLIIASTADHYYHKENWPPGSIDPEFKLDIK